eukprot:SAG11_NODE_1057_length_6008_cov_3.405991_2_plen_277_part_00
MALLRLQAPMAALACPRGAIRISRAAARPFAILTAAAPPDAVAAAAVHDVLTGRRTTGRHFDGRPIPQEVLHRAVEAAVHAPNHKLTEPWRFVQLGPRRAEQLGVLVAEHVGGEKGVRKQKAWSAVPSWVVVLCGGQSITETHTHNTMGDSTMSYTQLEDYAAVCCAVQNFTLSLHSSGIGCKWSTGGVTRKQAFREMIDCRDDEMVVGVLMCGYRSSEAPRLRPPVKRRPLVAIGADGDLDAVKNEDKMSVFDFKAKAMIDDARQGDVPVLSSTP